MSGFKPPGGVPGYVERAELNRVGPGWSDDRVERHPDYDLHLPLVDTRFDMTPPPITPAPLPNEQELRGQLAEALRIKSECETMAGRAQAAHDRAERHVERCKGRVAEYAGLDSAIAASTVEALRCDEGRMSPDMTEEQEIAIGDRELARAELTAAESALTTFRSEYAEAAEALGTASETADLLIAKVLVFEAERLALAHEEAMATATMLRGVLIGFDRFRTPQRGVGIPPLLGRVYGGIDQNTFARQVATTTWQLWRTAADQLRADPQATVTLALPEPGRVSSPLLEAQTKEAA
jgi:hypothetical protein